MNISQKSGAERESGFATSVVQPSGLTESMNGQAFAMFCASNIIHLGDAGGSRPARALAEVEQDPNERRVMCASIHAAEG